MSHVGLSLRRPYGLTVHTHMSLTHSHLQHHSFGRVGLRVHNRDATLHTQQHMCVCVREKQSSPFFLRAALHVYRRATLANLHAEGGRSTNLLTPALLLQPDERQPISHPRGQEGSTSPSSLRLGRHRTPAVPARGRTPLGRKAHGAPLSAATLLALLGLHPRSGQQIKAPLRLDRHSVRLQLHDE